MNITYYISLNMTSLLFACIRIHIFSPVTSCFLQLRGYMHVHEHYLLHFIKYDVIIICMYIRIHIFSPVTSCFLQLRGYMHVHEHYLLYFIKYDVIIICMYTYTHFFPSHILFSSTSWLYACT